MVPGKRKDKGLPFQSHEVLEGVTYIVPLSLTSALDVDVWSTPRPGRFTHGTVRVSIVYEAGWATRQIWTGVGEFNPAGIRPSIRPARSYSLHRLRYPSPTIPTATQRKHSLLPVIPEQHQINSVLISVY